MRQALFYAVDRDSIVKKLFNGLGVVAIGTMPVLSWAYAAGQDHDEVHLRSEESRADAGRCGLEAGLGRHPRQGRQEALLLDVDE